MRKMTAMTTAGLALVVQGPGNVGLEQRTYGPPGPSEVLIEPAFVGVCGSDLEVINGALDPAYVRYPVVLGHEWSGVVLATGADVERFNEGDHVVVEGIRACALCAPCREGRTNLCDNYEELGFTIDGAAGPAVIAPAALTHRVDDAIPLDAAVLIEPAAVVLRGLREVSPTPGSRVLVVGDGTVALLAAQLVRMWSPSKVSVAGRRAAQASLATAGHCASARRPCPKTSGADVWRSRFSMNSTNAASETSLRRPTLTLLSWRLAIRPKAVDRPTHRRSMTSSTVCNLAIVPIGSIVSPVSN
jgi:threonine dehydrogenase-like Zn-dependent dehydrogenase